MTNKHPVLRLALLVLSPHGRINRATYLFTTVVAFLICGLLVSTAVTLAGGRPTTGPGGRLALYGTLALVAWPQLALTAKRLHDLGLSGWLGLLTLLPFVSWLLAIPLYFMKGPERPVRYWPFRTIHA